MHTVVGSKKVVEDRLQTEIAKEVPADARHPPGVHVLSSYTGLQHTLELDSQRKREFYWYFGQPRELEETKGWSGKQREGNTLITYPLKNALIQLIISVFGMIMAIWFFIMPIMPSMELGSLIGFGGAWPRRSGSFR